MIKLSVIPRERQSLYSILVRKELELRRKNKGTLFRCGPKRRKEEKWRHTNRNGWIRFQEALGGILVATVQARDSDEEWMLLNSFVGFLDRHFRKDVSSITIHYETEG